MRVALIHDWLVTYAGAERLLEQVLEVCPQADLFSLIDFLPPDRRFFIKNKPVQTSFLQHFPLVRTKYRSYLPFMPAAIESLDVSKYDLVISVSHAVAKGVRTCPGQRHICLCCSPIRYAWDLRQQYLEESGLDRGLKGVLANFLLDRIKAWDLSVTPRVTHFAAISEYIGRRIKNNYGRNYSVLYPPVYVDRFAPIEKKENFYLTASRMVPYKKVPLIAEAFSAMPEKELFIIGDGPEFSKVKGKAGPNVKLLGYQENHVLTDYLQRARAFVFAAEEDFGIAPLEAQACGTPVIAYGAGAVKETIIEGETGLYFENQTVESIIDAVNRFESGGKIFDVAKIRRNAERFSSERFRTELSELVAEVMG
ncbi:MAG: glycosyl transferase family protein [Elusimicrobia bacterium]|nr:MAG: glycosyl transferase family protein [Elusimicrobiota bacterium]